VEVPLSAEALAGLYAPKLSVVADTLQAAHDDQCWLSGYRGCKASTVVVDHMPLWQIRTWVAESARTVFLTIDFRPGRGLSNEEVDDCLQRLTLCCTALPRCIERA